VNLSSYIVKPSCSVKELGPECPGYSAFGWMVVGRWCLLEVIGINKQFPGPILNVTTNWNVVVNVKNDLDEPLLLTW
ncbi:monocopper oxidase-like protein SKU5-like, partial [Trifolium medium]|nr:monocopper oxidase-like protein SKU5-like [Trifolium medium]